jgi:tetratricopeptide (TPR) repeat protein
MYTGEPVQGPPGARDVDLLRAMSARIDQRDPGAFNNLGVLYFSKGMYADAVDAFLHALSLDARMRTAARNLEVAAARPGACDARLSDLGRRLDANPDDVQARRDRARLLRLIGRQTDATQQLDALIAEDPDDAASIFERGLIEQRAGDLRRAQRWFERAVNADSGDPIIRLHLAEVLYQRGQNEQALEVLDLALQRDPTLAEAHLLRGFVLGDMGRHDAAIAAARHAGALNPALQSLQPHLSLESTPSVDVVERVAHGESGLARYGLGLAFRQRGYFDEARREFERALQHGEEERLARHALAELDLVAGRSTDAQAAYETLLAQLPDHPRYWNEHGIALHQGGDVAAAAESYRTALRYDPRYGLAYNNLGVALSDLGDQSAAREALLRASELEPTLVRARLNLARWYQQHDESLAALSLLRELVAFHATDADAWHALGTLYQTLLRPDEARDALLRAIELRPRHAEARYALADTLRALGDHDGALRETQLALNESPMRASVRLSVGIDLQRECPDACGALALLSVRGTTPLTGVPLDDGTVASLLPERAIRVADAPADIVDPSSAVSRSCDEADAFATRGLHGEAIERYTRAREALDAAEMSPKHDAYAAWRRAALGEARSRCLLGQGARALPLLKTLGTHDANDAEVLALYAASLSAAMADASAADRVANVDIARRAIVRTLRLEPESAALMHFVGDVALAIGDGGLALCCYRRALALDPMRPSPRVAIARMLRARGDVLAARLELVAALSALPGWRDAVLELAQVHRDADRPHEALVLLVDHLALMPTDLDALVQLAEVLIRLDRDIDGRVAVGRVLRHDPSHMHALWLDGVLLARQSRVRDAVDRWRRVADSDADATLVARAHEAMATAAGFAGAR